MSTYESLNNKHVFKKKERSMQNSFLSRYRDEINKSVLMIQLEMKVKILNQILK